MKHVFKVYNFQVSSTHSPLGDFHLLLDVNKTTVFHRKNTSYSELRGAVIGAPLGLLEADSEFFVPNFLVSFWFLISYGLQ